MSIFDAFKRFIKSLTGETPKGENIAELVNDGSVKVATLNSTINTLNASAIKYADDDQKSFVLASSTASSTKRFAITVADDGTITATEIVAAE